MLRTGLAGHIVWPWSSSDTRPCQKRRLSDSTETQRLVWLRFDSAAKCWRKLISTHLVGGIWRGGSRACGRSGAQPA